jgi:hypothetical protein
VGSKELGMIKEEDSSSRHWGMRVLIEMSDLLPIPKHSLFCRYEKEIKTFGEGCGFYIYRYYEGFLE